MIIKDAIIVNEGSLKQASLKILKGKIQEISEQEIIPDNSEEVIDAKGLHLFPGLIDDQVHFREPGLTHKGDIHSESKAAVAGGITSFMEMPNTIPNALTQQLLQEKYDIAAENSIANYSFYMGASNDNLEEVLKTDPTKVCGVKIFMGSSTGNMLVDDEKTLNGIFSEVPMLIASHCEDEKTIRANLQKYEPQKSQLDATIHPIIRSEEACYRSSAKAVELASKHGARLHILHISTAKEISLFNKAPLAEKKITAEACIHHLWFNDEDYKRLGNRIKWNPAVKKRSDRDAIRQAVNENLIDVIATDHAPHTIQEKSKIYWDAPSGGPLVQHGLLAMLELYHQDVFSLEKIAEKMCHAPAILFKIKNRGFIRKGYAADMVLVDLNAPYEVRAENILYKCGWSPFENQKFQSQVKFTFVNGNCVYKNGELNLQSRGERLTFEL